MKLGMFSALFHDLTLDDTLDYLQKVGFDAVEIACGGPHCNPDELLGNEIALERFKDSLKRRNLTLSMLNCSGNPVSPNQDVAKKTDENFRKGILLAEKLGLPGVIVFSGCPGGAPGDTTPNWVTCPWPDEYLEAYTYQWEEVLIPYWQKAAQFAADHGVNQLAFEMHPGFCVYSPESLLKLRAAVGPAIGANFDPSHLFWQGIDAAEAILELDDAIFHFHAKDTRVFQRNVQVHGVLDPKHYSEIKNRAWVFGTVGYGQGELVWRRILNALAIVGYDYVLSIEHEDALMSKEEGVQKGYAFLRRLMINEKPGEMWWA